MTKEDKELLLKDLCTRLPYKVYAQIPDEYGGYTSAIESIDIDGFVKDFEGEQIEIENIKPYLFPLSSITEEQKEEYCQLQQKIIYNSYGPVNADVINYINWCYKNHIDINGLIPMDLAIDATGKNIY
jgi:hypothetical protein